MLRMLPLLLLAACGAPDEEDWPEQYADAYCDFERRCLAAYYWERWDEPEDCFDDVRDDQEDWADVLDNECDFDEDKAQDCLSRMGGSCRSAGEDLDDLVEACAEVWDCD